MARVLLSVGSDAEATPCAKHSMTIRSAWAWASESRWICTSLNASKASIFSSSRRLSRWAAEPSRSCSRVRRVGVAGRQRVAGLDGAGRLGGDKSSQREGRCVLNLLLILAQKTSGDQHHEDGITAPKGRENIDIDPVLGDAILGQITHPSAAFARGLGRLNRVPGAK